MCQDPYCDFRTLEVNITAMIMSKFMILHFKGVRNVNDFIFMREWSSDTVSVIISKLSVCLPHTICCFKLLHYVPFLT